MSLPCLKHPLQTCVKQKNAQWLLWHLRLFPTQIQLITHQLLYKQCAPAFHIMASPPGVHTLLTSTLDSLKSFKTLSFTFISFPMKLYPQLLCLRDKPHVHSIGPHLL